MEKFSIPPLAVVPRNKIPRLFSIHKIPISHRIDMGGFGGRDIVRRFIEEG